MPSRQRARALLCAALLAGSACTAADEPRATQTPTPHDLLGIAVRAIKVADFFEPVALAVRPGDDALYVAEQEGRIMRLPLDDESNETEPVLVMDISERVRIGVNYGGELGLLGFAFALDGDSIYAVYTATPPDYEPELRQYDVGQRIDPPDRQHSVWTLAEFAVDADGAIDPASERILISFEKEWPQHNGGGVVFGPDGYLYISVGDTSPGRDAFETGQDPTDLLGSILRIDPEPDGDDPYGIPDDNPFAVSGEGAPEVWAYGLRNPWRFSFDPDTGDLWIADAGDDDWEEVNLLPAADGAARGANLGWSELEGTHVFEDGNPPPDHVEPIFEYEHGPGCAVVGGTLYSGRDINGLQGAYVYSDYCAGDLRAIVAHDGRLVAEASLGEKVFNPSTIGVGPDDELYVASLRDGLFRLTPVRGAPTPR